MMTVLLGLVVLTQLFPSLCLTHTLPLVLPYLDMKEPLYFSDSAALFIDLVIGTLVLTRGLFELVLTDSEFFSSTDGFLMATKGLFCDCRPNLCYLFISSHTF